MAGRMARPDRACLAAVPLLLLLACSSQRRPGDLLPPPPTPSYPTAAVAPGGSSPRIPARAVVVRPSLAEVRARIFEGANLDLAAEVMRQAEARGRVRQAALPPNPYVMFRKRRISDFEVFDTGFAELEVGQPFELGGKRPARVAEARAQAAQVSEEVRARTVETMRETELAWWRVLRLAADLEQAREEQRATRELAALVVSRFERGKDSRFAALRLEAQSRDADLTVQDLERQHGVACRSLDQLLGQPAGTVVGVEGEWTLAQLANIDREAARRTLACHPRRRAADLAVEAARRGVRRADAEQWPDLTVGLAAEHDGDSDRDYLGVLLHTPIPLWNRNEGARAQARAAAIRACRSQAAEILRLDVELDAALLAYEKASLNAHGYATDILPRLETSLALARQAYDAGRTPYLDVLDALIALVRARRAHIAHLENQARAATEIRYLTGS